MSFVILRVFAVKIFASVHVFVCVRLCTLALQCLDIKREYNGALNDADYISHKGTKDTKGFMDIRDSLCLCARKNWKINNQCHLRQNVALHRVFNDRDDVSYKGRTKFFLLPSAVFWLRRCRDGNVVSFSQFYDRGSVNRRTACSNCSARIGLFNIASALIHERSATDSNENSIPNSLTALFKSTIGMFG